MAAGQPCLALVLFQAEANLDGDLPICDLSVLQVAADLLDLKPVEVPQGLGCLGNAVADGVVHALGGGADNFRNAVRVVGQLRSS